MKAKIKALGQYENATTDKKGNIVLKFKFSYDEREALAKMMILPGQTIKCSAKYGKSKPVNLGEFDFKQLTIDRDGQGIIQLSTEYASFEYESIGELLPLDDGTVKLVDVILDLDIEDENAETQRMNTEEVMTEDDQEDWDENESPEEDDDGDWDEDEDPKLYEDDDEDGWDA